MTFQVKLDIIKAQPKTKFHDPGSISWTASLLKPSCVGALKERKKGTKKLRQNEKAVLCTSLIRELTIRHTDSNLSCTNRSSFLMSWFYMWYYSAGQKFRTLILCCFFYSPPLREGAEVHYKMITTSKVGLSPPRRLQKNSDLNVRNFWPASYMVKPRFLFKTVDPWR